MRNEAYVDKLFTKVNDPKASEGQIDRIVDMTLVRLRQTRAGKAAVSRLESRVVSKALRQMAADGIPGITVRQRRAPAAKRATKAKKPTPAKAAGKEIQ